MIRLRTLALLLTLALLSGCGMLHSEAQSGKLLAPESFGLIPIAPHLYVEAGIDEATQDGLRAEMSTRLTLFAWKRMPQWFDEGLAVTISEAPEHSENHWQFLITANIPRPTSNELLTYQSLQQWQAGVHRFGDDKNFERVSQGSPTLSPVYAAAGHEVRLRLTQMGSSGLLNLIQRMNTGEDFASSYSKIHATD